jgi:putative DNA methylase
MNTPAPIRKKLIEVALPLEAINDAAAREKSIRHGHPSTLHLWWARRPLAAARAVIFAQMVDDPSAWPDLFPTDKAQEKERQRLFKIIEDLVKWENTTNLEVLGKATDEIWRSWRRACAENVDHPQARELFNRETLPAFHDPFAGGGALPLEAQRLGLESFATDLNPVAVLINKAMIEIPPKFAGNPPVNPDAQAAKHLNTWAGGAGLADDVRYYGGLMRDEAEKRIGHLYPKIKVTPEMVADRPDLAPYLHKSLTVIAWIWARTVKSPNPAFREVDVPLTTTFMLGTKPGKEAYVATELQRSSYRFVVRTGIPPDPEAAKRGTKSASSGSSFLCLMSGTPMPFDYLRAEAKAGRMGSRLMAIVAEGDRGRIYLTPTDELEQIAQVESQIDAADVDLPSRALGFRIQEYGMTQWSSLFTPRQRMALATFADIAAHCGELVQRDAEALGINGSKEYADAVRTYLGLAVGRLSDYCSTICTWANNPQMEIVRGTFARQALPMTWDYAEANPFGPSTGSLEIILGWIFKVIERLPAKGRGFAEQGDATVGLNRPGKRVVSADPPYYDNIGYADLSDFFYIWLRQALRTTYPSLFATMAVPKAEELIATPFRHSSRTEADSFFLDGMTEAMRRISETAHPAIPITLYYAFKQSEENGESGVASTGWETFLGAVLRSGLTLSGTWPVRTERQGRSIGIGTNALASSIVLVCRQRASDAPTATRREFLTALERELPKAIADLQRGNVAPVDLQQAAIGPGMGIFTRYTQVLDAEGNPLSVREALTLINQALDEVLAHQEGDFDSDTRWALAWFEQFGFAEGDYGVAEMLSKAKNTSVDGIRQAGIGTHGKGKVRLFKPEELPADWSPESDIRLTVWDMVHHLIRTLEQGEEAAGRMLAKLGSQADVARELAYRLYSICERKKRSADAQRYNSLVSSWPELVRLAQQAPQQDQGPQQSFEGMN